MGNDNNSPRSSDTRAEKQIRVLVVEDEPIIQDLLVQQFSKDNVQVVTAINGLEGIRKAASQRFDLIVSDLVMPSLNGVEFCELARKTVLNNRTRILVVSGYIDQFSKERLDLLGEVFLIDKPCDLSECDKHIQLISARKLLHRRTVATSDFPEFSLIAAELQALFASQTLGHQAVVTRPSIPLVERLKFDFPIAIGLLFGRSIVAEIHCSLSPDYIQEFQRNQPQSISKITRMGQDEVTRSVCEQGLLGVKRTFQATLPTETLHIGRVWTYCGDAYNPMNPTGREFTSIELAGTKGVSMSVDMAILRNLER